MSVLVVGLLCLQVDFWQMLRMDCWVWYRLDGKSGGPERHDKQQQPPGSNVSAAARGFAPLRACLRCPRRFWPLPERGTNPFQLPDTRPGNPQSAHPSSQDCLPSSGRSLRVQQTSRSLASHVLHDTLLMSMEGAQPA